MFAWSSDFVIYREGGRGIDHVGLFLNYLLTAVVSMVIASLIFEGSWVNLVGRRASTMSVLPMGSLGNMPHPTDTMHAMSVLSFLLKAQKKQNAIELLKIKDHLPFLLLFETSEVLNDVCEGKVARVVGNYSTIDVVIKFLKQHWCSRSVAGHSPHLLCIVR